MSWGDVRGLLQYVPQFSGKVFVVIVDAPVSALAETMLDLLSLQNIGVQLIVSSTVHSKDDLLDRAAEVELKYCNTCHDVAAPASDVMAAVLRGQAVIIDCFGHDVFAEPLMTLAGEVSAKKVIYLQGGEASLPQGALSACEVSEKDSLLLRQAAEVSQGGVPRVHLLNGADFGVLLSELFSNEGVGTMIYADRYQVIRPIREEDIVELLGMIGRSVRNAHLVPRHYAEVEENMSDYFVMEIDGNVVGSVALYQYEETGMAEVACLYVKQSHEGQGYASDLVYYVQEHARELGLKQVFSLTNRIATFFEKKMSYQEVSVSKIPESRQQQLQLSGRTSRAFCLDL